MDRDSSALTFRDRESIGYIAEGQSLPKWMRLEQAEAYLAPLYPTWDAALARDLRQRFGLDPRRKIGTLSRGEQMKAALLCALAPRPRLLLMDEPFTGMDALVKDELVRGLLESAGAEGWTVILSSHDLAELELLADWVGFLDDGQMLVSESMETLRARFRRVEVTLGDGRKASEVEPPADAMSVERAGPRLTFLIAHAGDDLNRVLAERFPGGVRIETRDASLREVFIALATRSSRRTSAECVVRDGPSAGRPCDDEGHPGGPVGDSRL